MMKKNINKFYMIFSEFQKNVSDEFTTEDLIKATKDLIKYSKNDFTHKSLIKDYSNDNRKPLDKIFSKNQEINILNYDFYNDDEKDLIEKYSFQKFQQINNKY